MLANEFLPQAQSIEGSNCHETDFSLDTYNSVLTERNDFEAPPETKPVTTLTSALDFLHARDSGLSICIHALSSPRKSIEQALVDYANSLD